MKLEIDTDLICTAKIQKKSMLGTSEEIICKRLGWF